MTGLVGVFLILSGFGFLVEWRKTKVKKCLLNMVLCFAGFITLVILVNFV